MSFSPEEYKELLAEFRRCADEAYKKFNESLIPGTETAYGVRLPKLREMAKDVIRRDAEGFLAVSRTGSYEEILLRGLVIAGMKTGSSRRLELVSAFLPLIDNWAVCDSFCSTFRFPNEEEKQRMWEFLRPLFLDSREFFARFAAVMLLDHYVTKEYLPEGLSLLKGVRSEAYYVQMAVAWAVSVCYVKFPAETLPLLQERVLPPFTQNKSIQKIRESFRVGKADKEMLLQYKL